LRLEAARIVSGGAAENRLTPAQVKTDGKSNEITAIPDVLALAALKGAIVTIDAMGCRYKIAEQILEGGVRDEGVESGCGVCYNRGRMTDIKLIAFDLDDTLFRSDLSISGRTRSVIKKAVQRGIVPVIAS
jgi:hypothetical protein